MKKKVKKSKKKLLIALGLIGVLILVITLGLTKTCHKEYITVREDDPFRDWLHTTVYVEEL